MSPSAWPSKCARGLPFAASGFTSCVGAVAAAAEKWHALQPEVARTLQRLVFVSQVYLSHCVLFLFCPSSILRTSSLLIFSAFHLTGGSCAWADLWCPLSVRPRRGNRCWQPESGSRHPAGGDQAVTQAVDRHRRAEQIRASWSGCHMYIA